MPRVYLTTEEREVNRISDFIRGELRRQNRRYSDVAKELNLSTASISQKINGKVPWSLAEVVQIFHYLKASWTIGSGNER
jgi:hypothetical protein